MSAGFSRQELVGLFEEVTYQDVVAHPYALPAENDRPIHLCFGPRYDLEAYWRVHPHMDARLLGMLDEDGVPTARSQAPIHEDPKRAGADVTVVAP